MNNQREAIDVAASPAHAIVASPAAQKAVENLSNQAEKILANEMPDDEISANEILTNEILTNESPDDKTPDDEIPGEVSKVTEISAVIEVIEPVISDVPDGLTFVDDPFEKIDSLEEIDRLEKIDPLEDIAEALAAYLTWSLLVNSVIEQRREENWPGDRH